MNQVIPSEQHDKEIHENAISWKRKAVLRRVYGDFYQGIKQSLVNANGVIVELGSGMGQVKEFIPNCVTTDIFPNPWLDRVENAYALSFKDESIDSIILFDVWHHLQYPGTALNEFKRVLKKGGRIIIFDHAMGLLGKLVGCVHHEPLALESTIQWSAPESFDPLDTPYYAAQGNAWRIFRNAEFSGVFSNWKIITTIYWTGLTWIGSGGFRGPQLYPDWCFPLVKTLDRFLGLFSSVFASRMLIVLENTHSV